MLDDMPGSLWSFSLEVYRRPGVEEACLKLQDDIGADVNILIYCCWRGTLAEGEMAALLPELAPWQSGVVRGLRTVRRILKPMLADMGDLSAAAADLREKIAALELEAEKLQQAMLSRHPANRGEAAPPSPQAAVQNLTQYFEILAKVPDRNARNALETLVRAAFPNAAEDDIKAAIANLKNRSSAHQ